jgi:hypothetical protein
LSVGLKDTTRKQMEIYAHGHENTISLLSLIIEKWAKKPGKRSSVIKKGDKKDLLHPSGLICS